MKCIGSLLALIVLTLSIQAAYGADKKVTFKLGTLVPTGTSYHKQLMLLREKWQKASGGSVQMVVYPDGRQGTEAEMVAAMSTGNLQAGLLTAAGLALIEPSVVALQSMPLIFHSLEEVDYVTEKMGPSLEERLSAKGFVVLFWTDSGWVRFFSKQPVISPDDLRKLKVFSWAGGKGEYEAWKAGGFHPVSLEPSEIFSSLGTGIITAAPLPPFFALATQVDTLAPHMLDLNWAPLVGALVVRRDGWERISSELRLQLMRIATETGREVKARGRAEAVESVAAMQKRKLNVHPVTPEASAEWAALLVQMRDHVRGPIVPAELYDSVQGHLNEFRAGRVGK